MLRLEEQRQIAVDLQQAIDVERHAVGLARQETHLFQLREGVGELGQDVDAELGLEISGIQPIPFLICRIISRISSCFDVTGKARPSGNSPLSSISM